MKIKLLTILIFLFCSTQLNAGQYPPTYTFTGEAAGDLFGYSVASAGDVNNDGYNDFIISAHRNDAKNTEEGRVYVFSGKTGDTLYVFSGEMYNDLFGWSISTAGDVNNDGFDDIMIGSTRNSNTFDYAGRVYIFSGKDGDTLYTYEGQSLGMQLGYRVAAAGDLDGDDYDDFVITTRVYNIVSNNSGEGAVFVFSGKTGDTLYSWIGEEYYNNFGYSVAANGDINADGVNDIVIGARGHSEIEPAAGRVYVFSGLTGDTLQVYNGEVNFQEFGKSVSAGGDVNNDGFDDILIGSILIPAMDSSANFAYLFSGDTGDTLQLFGTTGYPELFGYSLSILGDIDNDGYDDFAIGSPLSEANSLVNAGKLFVFSGQSGDTLLLLSGTIYGEQLGWSVAALGDIDGDGYVSILVGAPGNNEAGSGAGKAYVFSLCCFGGRGDINGDNSNGNILDLTFVIDFIFRGGEQATCLGEADINSDGTPSNILDLTYLVDFIFRGGPAPGPCY